MIYALTSSIYSAQFIVAFPQQAETFLDSALTSTLLLFASPSSHFCRFSRTGCKNHKFGPVDCRSARINAAFTNINAIVLHHFESRTNASTTPSPRATDTSIAIVKSPCENMATSRSDANQLHTPDEQNAGTASTDKYVKRPSKRLGKTQ